MKSKTKKKIIIIIAAIAILLFVVFGLNGFYINFIWFKNLGYLQVFLKGLITKLKIIVPLFIVLAIGIYLLLIRVEKSSPKGVLKIAQSDREIRRKKRIRFFISIAVSFIASLYVVNVIWYKLLEYISATDFGTVDPIFNKEISFYVFKIPFYSELLNIAFFLLLLSAIITILYMAYLYAKNLGTGMFAPGENAIFEVKSILKKIWEVASKYIIVFVFILFILISVSFYLKRFDLLYSTRGVGYGASYTDVKIMLPLYWGLSGLSILGAFGIIIFGIKGKIRNLIAIPVLLIAVGVLGNVAAFIVENYIVQPNQYNKELTYMQYNIDFTRKAYNIENVTVKEFNTTQDIDSKTIANNPITINNIPINDVNPTLDMYNSLQGIRQYYVFNDIDVDRYYFNGEYRQVFAGAREININNLADNAKTWINQHLKYTHGFGLAISPVNEVTSVGQPALALKDIPPTTTIPELTVSEPRIYFGEEADSYAIVNTKTDEFDYPQGDNNAETQYKENAGLSLKGYNRVAFAINQGTVKILLSTDITSDSKILIRRNVMERVKALAPFLSYDNDPYMIIAGGKLYWIVEGYTTTGKYPYSQPYSSASSVNYMRNSVKIVVDAYTGKVDFYLVDKNDPIANTYNKIYNGIFKPIEEMDKQIFAHIKYPVEYFNVQAEIYRTYHMTNPQVFYNKEDQWEVATQIYSTSTEAQPVKSSYTIMKLPDRQEEFLLMLPFTPRGKDNMIAWMAGMSDGNEYGKLIVYTFSKQSLVYGPMQMEKRIDQDAIIAPQLTLLNQQGKGLIRGNLMTIP
ncbi:MAG: UPF0182 family protein, partial [Eubacteriaceae bacterium]|nr:UPF0182 family protein [Eubacteriaceae bacterium]